MILSDGGTTGFFFWCIGRVLIPPDRTDKIRRRRSGARSLIVLSPLKRSDTHRSRLRQHWCAVGVPRVGGKGR